MNLSQAARLTVGLLTDALLIVGLILATFGTFHNRGLLVAGGAVCLIVFTWLGHRIEPCDCECHTDVTGSVS